MKHIGLMFLVTFMIGCDQMPDEVINHPKIDCELIGFVNVQRWRTEVLSIDSMMIDGEFPLKSTIDNYKMKLGKVQENYRIQKEDVALYGDISDRKNRYVFKGALVDTWGDRAIINTLDFKLNNIEIVHPRITLRKGMPVAELSKLFPASSRLIQSNGNSWSGFIVLNSSLSSFDFTRIILIFQTEELVKIKIVDFGFDIY